MIIHTSLVELISLILGAIAFLYVIGCIIIAKVIDYRTRKEKKKCQKNTEVK